MADKTLNPLTSSPVADVDATVDLSTARSPADSTLPQQIAGEITLVDLKSSSLTTATMQELRDRYVDAVVPDKFVGEAGSIVKQFHFGAIQALAQQVVAERGFSVDEMASIDGATVRSPSRLVGQG